MEVLNHNNPAELTVTAHTQMILGFSPLPFLQSHFDVGWQVPQRLPSVSLSAQRSLSCMLACAGSCLGSYLGL